MKKFLIQTVLLIVLIGGALFFFNQGNSNGSKSLDIPFLPQSPKTANLQINNTTLKVEVADTASKRNKGLGGRQSLAENEGMLFVFDKADKHPFWMKGLSFPLDFVWIKDDKVVDVTPNIQPPKKGEPDSALPIYSSKVEVDKVLEVNAGTIQKLNIKEGDTIKVE